MSEDETARTTALALAAQYGDYAPVIATLRAAEFAAAGDVDALAHWDRVIVYLSAMSDDGPPQGLVN